MDSPTLVTAQDVQQDVQRDAQRKEVRNAEMAPTNSGYYVEGAQACRLVSLVHSNIAVYILVDGRTDSAIVAFVTQRLVRRLRDEKHQLHHDTDIIMLLSVIFEDIDSEWLMKKNNESCEVTIAIQAKQRLSLINLGTCLSFISEQEVCISLATVHDINNQSDVDAMEENGVNKSTLIEGMRSRNYSCTRVIGDYGFKQQFCDTNNMSLILSEPELKLPSYVLSDRNGQRSRYLVLASTRLRTVVQRIVQSQVDQDINEFISNIILANFQTTATSVVSVAKKSIEQILEQYASSSSSSPCSTSDTDIEHHALLLFIHDLTATTSTSPHDLDKDTSLRVVAVPYLCGATDSSLSCDDDDEELLYNDLVEEIYKLKHGDTDDPSTGSYSTGTSNSADNSSSGKDSDSPTESHSMISTKNTGNSIEIECRVDFSDYLKAFDGVAGETQEKIKSFLL